MRFAREDAQPEDGEGVHEDRSRVGHVPRRV